MLISALLPGIQFLIMGMAFALGLSIHPEDFASFWRQRSQALRAGFAMFVCVPLVAVLLTRLLPLSPAAATTLIVLAASSGVPLLPRKLHWLEHSPFTFGLLLNSVLCASFMLPLWIHFAAHPEHEPPALQVFSVMARAYLLPMLCGILLHRLRPAFAERLSQGMIRIGSLLLLALVVCVLGTQWHLFADLNGTNMLALTLLFTASIAIGHLLGGPAPKDRAALAISCSQRFAGVAVLLSTSPPGGELLFGVLVYALLAQLLEQPYVMWQKRHMASPAGLISSGSVPPPP
ncbi:bile acid:sodium symporter family protein [Uliginosibacterium sp. TH139]|uniref:bile acid:sodium symporter family protein n=1 Tax=Uliginosibacterium sp. TH139 TaxID=2067453 RepID=UPI000C7B2D12|nr:hypothetical protein [Uliginosibacterium sp. TH139]PLK50037.1 hypothetical protein C0V76_06420 [Uliginosibacterium sp. TH139]